MRAVIITDHEHSTGEGNVFTCVFDFVKRGRVSPQGTYTHPLGQGDPTLQIDVTPPLPPDREGPWKKN